MPIFNHNLQLEIPGFTRIRSDYSPNSKGGGACFLCNSTLLLKVLGIHYLQISINLGVSFDNKNK